MLGAPHPSVYFLCWEPSHKGFSQSGDLTHGRALKPGVPHTFVFLTPEALHICGPSHLEPFTHGSSHTWEPLPLGRRRWGVPDTFDPSHLAILTPWNPHIWDRSHLFFYIYLGTLRYGSSHTWGFSHLEVFIPGNPFHMKTLHTWGSSTNGVTHTWEP